MSAVPKNYEDYPQIRIKTIHNKNHIVIVLTIITIISKINVKPKSKKYRTLQDPLLLESLSYNYQLKRYSLIHVISYVNNSNCYQSTPLSHNSLTKFPQTIKNSLQSIYQ